MKSPLVIFLFLLGTVGLTAQSATIVDADGRTLEKSHLKIRK